MGSDFELSALVSPGSSNPMRGSVLLALTHNEVGIPSDKLPYICDMFTQLGTRRPSADGGLGIGLALVKYWVECHGGTLFIVSAGEGYETTVTINLPVLNRPVNSVPFK
jgi:signal transduction histidine kinase